MLVDPAQDLQRILSFVSEASRPPTQLRMSTTGPPGESGPRRTYPLDFNPARPSVSDVLSGAKLMDAPAWGSSGAAWSWSSSAASSSSSPSFFARLWGRLMPRR